LLGLVNLLELLVVGYSPGLLAMAESVRTRTRFEGVGVDGDATDERGMTHVVRAGRGMSGCLPGRTCDPTIPWLALPACVRAHP
jgi:hypothetical protein